MYYTVNNCFNTKSYEEIHTKKKKLNGKIILVNETKKNR